MVGILLGLFVVLLVGLLVVVLLGLLVVLVVGLRPLPRLLRHPATTPLLPVLSQSPLLPHPYYYTHTTTLLLTNYDTQLPPTTARRIESTALPAHGTRCH